MNGGRGAPPVALRPSRLDAVTGGALPCACVRVCVRAFCFLARGLSLETRRACSPHSACIYPSLECPWRRLNRPNPTALTRLRPKGAERQKQAESSYANASGRLRAPPVLFPVVGAGGQGAVAGEGDDHRIGGGRRRHGRRHRSHHHPRRRAVATPPSQGRRRERGVRCSPPRRARHRDGHGLHTVAEIAKRPVCGRAAPPQHRMH